VETENEREREGTEMKEMMKGKMSFLGAGTGITLFAIFGLLPGAFLGGVMGLNTAGALFGLPVTSELLPRAVVALGMLLGVTVGGLIFTAGGAALGWLVGLGLDTAMGHAAHGAAHGAK
jgi:hypothetical protein